MWLGSVLAFVLLCFTLPFFPVMFCCYSHPISKTFLLHDLCYPTRDPRLNTDKLLAHGPHASHTGHAHTRFSGGEVPILQVTPLWQHEFDTSALLYYHNQSELSYTIMSVKKWCLLFAFALSEEKITHIPFGQQVILHCPTLKLSMF